MTDSEVIARAALHPHLISPTSLSFRAVKDNSMVIKTVGQARTEFSLILARVNQEI